MGQTVTVVRKVGVIGAGTMGAKIAAHVAGAGLPVVLLDVTGPDPARPISTAALDRMIAANPPILMSGDDAARIRTGTVEADFGLLADCDWIVESVVEDLAIKQDLYRRLQDHRASGSIVTSNTSTIPIEALLTGLPEPLANDFAVTHFFDPPRTMRLLELVAGPNTRPAALAALADLGDRTLGKTVVVCRDRPGLLANRLGIYWMLLAVTSAIDLGLTVEEADAVCGEIMGVPKTGVFGLSDLVGVDQMQKANASMAVSLASDDPFHDAYRSIPIVDRLVAAGLTGRRAGGGFYRTKGYAGERTVEAVDLGSGEYRPFVPPRLDSLRAAREGGLRALASHSDRGGKFAWRVLSHILSYAAAMVPEVTDHPDDIDTAMRLVYNWKLGPFELQDQVGATWLAEGLVAEGRPVPPLLGAARGTTIYSPATRPMNVLGADGRHHPIKRPSGVLRLDDLAAGRPPLARNGSAILQDIGEGVACLSFTTKAGTIDRPIVDFIPAVVDLVKQSMSALVIYNDGQQFCAGADLAAVRDAIVAGDWAGVEAFNRDGQAAMVVLQNAPFPVVAAPAGFALGGGCELLLHSDAVQAHAELYAGLVEVNVGMIPAWGGCAVMLDRLSDGDPAASAQRAFEMMMSARVSTSAPDARIMGILRRIDAITMNRDRLLADAKARALEMASGYRPPDRGSVSVAGFGSADTLLASLATGDSPDVHTQRIAKKLATVLTGGRGAAPGRVSTEVIRAAERQGFLALIQTPESLARIEHMLSIGKPLKN